MNKQRPVFLNLVQIRLPIPAIASILHRISGIVIFIALPFLLWGLQKSLTGAEGYNHIQDCMSHVVVKALIWTLLSAVFYHILAGIRHLLMDLGLGETLSTARMSATLVISAAILLSVATGVWLW